MELLISTRFLVEQRKQLAVALRERRFSEASVSSVSKAIDEAISRRPERLFVFMDKRKSEAQKAELLAAGMPFEETEALRRTARSPSLSLLIVPQRAALSRP